MKKNENYESPEVKVILVSVERGFAGSGNGGVTLPGVEDGGSAVGLKNVWNNF